MSKRIPFHMGIDISIQENCLCVWAFERTSVKFCVVIWISSPSVGLVLQRLPVFLGAIPFLPFLKRGLFFDDFGVIIFVKMFEFWRVAALPRVWINRVMMMRIPDVSRVRFPATVRLEWNWTPPTIRWFPRVLWCGWTRLVSPCVLRHDFQLNESSLLVYMRSCVSVNVIFNFDDALCVIRIGIGILLIRLFSRDSVNLTLLFPRCLKFLVFTLNVINRNCIGVNRRQSTYRKIQKFLVGPLPRFLSLSLTQQMRLLCEL